MNAAELEIARRLAEIRDGFDGSFARPATAAAASSVGLVAARVRAQAYAFRIEELTDVHEACKVVRIPGSHQHLLGVAGIRGRMVPVYGLSSILGHEQAGDWKWLALTRSRLALGLTLDELEGYLQASASELFPAADDERKRGHVSHVLRRDASTRLVISTTSILAALASAAGRSAKGS